MKKTVSALCILILMLSLCVPMVSAASASSSISLSSSSVTVGNSVKVTVKYTADEAIGSWNFQLKYDKSYLEYVGGADSGGAGVLNFCNYSDSDSKKSISQTVTFKTLKVGSAAVSVNTLEIVSNSISKMNASNSSATITIKARPEASDNANLSALKISPGTLSPSFSSSVTEYKATVDYNVTNLIVSASTADSGATKSVSGTALGVGENKVKITVTAESGEKKTYTITVTRGESPLANVTITIGAITYKVVYGEELKSPGEGFTESTALYKGNSIPAYSAANDAFKVILLKSPSGELCPFIYDESAGAFTKYLSVTAPSKELIVLDMPTEQPVPSGYELKSFALDEKNTVNAFVKIGDESAKVAIVYAMKADGTKSLYIYDKENKLFFDYASLEAVQAGATEYTGITTESYDTLASKLLKTQDDLKTSQILMLVIASLFSVLLVIGMVYAVKLRKTNKENKN